MRIRRVDRSDDDGVWAILEPFLRAGETYTLDRDISRDDALTYWFAASHGVFVAEDGEDLLGTYFLRRNQGGGGAHVCNCGYVTASAARGRGVARAMLTHSLEEAPRQGFRAMQYNFVVETNVRAIDIWRRAGFQEIGRLPGAFNHPVQGWVDALVMWRDLTGG